MDEFIKKSEAVDVIVKYPYNVAFKQAKAIKMIEDLPTADVVPKSEVAREIVAKFKTKMHSEIARNELLAEYGDDFYEGRVDAFHTAIEHLTEIAMAYWCDAQNEATDV